MPFNAALDARWISKNGINVATSGLGCSLKVWMRRTERESEELSPDPFQALKNAELIAEAIAHQLAPKRVPRAGKVRRSFCFQGHRLLFRKLNLLRAARALVAKALQNSADFASCLHRETLWTNTVSHSSPRRYGGAASKVHQTLTTVALQDSIFARKLETRCKTGWKARK
jgi:hypothetical protein